MRQLLYICSLAQQALRLLNKWLHHWLQGLLRLLYQVIDNGHSLQQASNLSKVQRHCCQQQHKGDGHNGAEAAAAVPATAPEH